MLWPKFLKERALIGKRIAQGKFCYKEKGTSTEVQLRTFFSFFVGLGFKLRAFCSAKQGLYCLSPPPVQFTLVILEMGSHELFSQVGLKPPSSQSQPPK
jgi:hypothetical protein